MNQRMNILDEIRSIIARLQDIDENTIGPESYLVRDLDIESIDMFELAALINTRFSVTVNDAALFLKDLRIHYRDAQSRNVDGARHLSSLFPHLANERIDEIIRDLENGPTIKVKDIAAYIKYQRK
jgi:acyl carrier protein